MKILFVGDVVGRAGRKILEERLPEIQQEHEIEFTIANVENAAGGFGVTPSVGEKILGYGVDVMTSGNHIWDKKEVFDYFDQQPRLLRPGNYPPGGPGQYQFVGEARSGVLVAVVNLQGRVFMPIIDCPFQFAEREIPKLAKQASAIVVDFHAEATSEKVAFGWFMNGKVSAVIGTHTHIPTADARVLPEGTAYISDVGMTGSYESVIGMEVDSSLSRFLTGLPSHFKPATEEPCLSSVILDIDESDGSARSIRRLSVS
ncbi:MAG: TIGR00282 family metallophosphoesterase [Acidobacteria bacterium]|nr:TIGR00282 family metallophosphoesterase [Acidobacteriota bacterium]